MPHRISTPPQNEPEDDQALNAAAAREVSRELDALMFNSPLGSQGSAPSSQVRQSAPPPQPAPEEIQTPVSSYSHEPQYVRERFRSATLQSSHSREGGIAADDAASASLAINRPVNTPSPALSHRTPDEYPSGGSPAPPRPFYSMGAVSGSASSLPGGETPRTISAAAFKRARPLGSVSPIDGGSVVDVSPLSIQKRSSRNLQPGDVPGQQRIASAPGGPRYSPEAGDGSDLRNRVSSAVYPPADGQGGYDDTYDYISAYTNPPQNH